VPDELIGQTLDELRQRYDAVSSETQVIRGQWQHQGQTYFDDLIRVWVDVSADVDAFPFFTEYKETLKQRFQQLDIWIVTHPIRVV
jgi:hypothetical protein